MCVVFPVLVLPLLTSEKVGHHESGNRECVCVCVSGILTRKKKKKKQKDDEGRKGGGLMVYLSPLDHTV